MNAVQSSSNGDLERDVVEKRLRFVDTLVTAELRSIRALNNGTTGFRMWDALERRTAATQIGTLNRWNKGEQTA